MLEFAPDDGISERWRLGSLRAVTGSSSSLQLRTHDDAILSVHPIESSLRLWDELLRDAIRAVYESAGKGRIVEFQPRIVTVPSLAAR